MAHSTTSTALGSDPEAPYMMNLERCLLGTEEIQLPEPLIEDVCTILLTSPVFGILS